MATARTSTQTFHIEAELKEALRAAEQNEARSVINMAAVPTGRHCEQKSIGIWKLQGKTANDILR
ncbi:MAG: hypothetical protein KZQ58_03185 [gamma proteobacterium symbiont of Bathyaustriella thionipta]|nr:hypothetical protein [gamma proteobacterium symbiont of Bathyaustriella thionipta]